METIIMNIILYAGDAKSKCLMAFKEARKNNFDEADKYLSDACKSISLAHQTQTELIQKEISGEPTQLSLLLIHAQDHLMMALATKDLVIEMIEFAKMLQKN